MSNNEKITTELFNDWAQNGRGQSMATGHNELVEKLFDSLELNNTKLLDIGCGIGGALSSALKFEPALLAGIDVSNEMINEAKSNLPQADLHHGSVLQLPWQDQYFDQVISIEAMYYFDDIDKALKEIYRVLTENGRFSSVIEYYTDNKGSLIWANNLPMRIHCLSEIEWKVAFEKAGFTQVETSRIKRAKHKSEEEFQASSYFPNYPMYIQYVNAGALHITGVK